MSPFHQMKLFTGTANPALAEEIADFLSVSLGGVHISRFANGEIYVRFKESIRGADVFVIQPCSKPVNETLMELLIMVDALKRASAGRITTVIPFYAYARQEKKSAPREPITARMVADILSTAGVDRIVTMDLHAPAIQGFFNIPVDHLTALPKLSQYIKEKNIKNGVVIGPDAGSVKKAEKLAASLHWPLGVMYKRRPAPNVAEMSFFIGEVKDKTSIIIDDMIDTGGSLEQVITALEERGAREIYILATHGVFSPPALKRLNRPSIKEIVVCNTLPRSEGNSHPKLKVLSVASLLGDTIGRIHRNISVSELFE